MLAAFFSVPANVGYPLLALLVGAESAGALVPGETALIVAAALAARGHLSLPLVIGVAAAAAIVGDNLGYVLGRRGLRPLLTRREHPGRRQQLLARGEEFFVRHGNGAVFFGRWLPGLRVAAAWLAGADAMPWRRFLFWNALGGIGWAITIGSAAFVLGKSASGSLGAIGFVGLTITALVFLLARIRDRGRWRRPHAGAASKNSPGHRTAADAPPIVPQHTTTDDARLTD
jgi:membrane protein DedA with SNARE-associated domain